MGPFDVDLHLLHVVLSLVGIFADLVVMFGLVGGKRFDAWTAVFLATTVATIVTGFGFPFDHLLPSHKVGIVVAGAPGGDRGPLRVPPRRRLAADLRDHRCDGAIPQHLRSGRPALPQGAGTQSARPTQKEPPFVIAQLAVLVLFAVLAGLATVRFRAEPKPAR